MVYICIYLFIYIMAGQSQADNSFSSIDFEDFKCSECEKYLSAAPIYIYTDSIDGKDKNVCGRCLVPDDENAKIRNVSYELLAKYLKFPCSISKNCRKKLAWGEAENHEAECRHREMVCKICYALFRITSVISHYKQHHQKELFYKKNLVIPEGDIFNHTYPGIVLVVCDKITCLVHIQVKTTVKIKVEPEFASSIPHAFTVTFSTRKNSIKFKNLQIKTHQIQTSTMDWEEYDFNINRILDIFMSDASEFKMELEIYEEGTDKGQATEENANNTSNNDLMNKASGGMEEISKALECPTCFEVMAANIYLCRRGHSICESCRKLVGVCPTCKGSFMGARNYGLEEISRKLKDYL